MACILQPKCNFLHGFFRCHLPVEMVDVEVQITSMQGTHTLRRDRTCQIIKCNPWSTRLHPHPTLIKKIRTYLELEGKLGPKPKNQSHQNQSRLTQPNKNPVVWREAKATHKRRKLIPTKRYKVWVVAKPESNPKASIIIMQTSTLAPSVTINLEKGNPFQGSSSGNNPPLLENIPTCAGTPWPEAGSMSGNLFELRKDWPIPATSTSNLPNKDRATIPRSSTPHAIVTPKVEKCGWGPNWTWSSSSQSCSTLTYTWLLYTAFYGIGMLFLW